MTLSTSPGKIATERRLGQCRVPLGQCWINGHGGGCGVVGCSRALCKRQHGKGPQPVVIQRHTGVGDRIVWVKRDRLVITDDGPRKAVLSECIPVKASTKISLVRLRIVGASFGQPDALVARQLWNDC